MIGAGELNRRITIETVEFSNRGGIAKRVPVSTLTVWAKLSPIKGLERYAQEGTASESEVRFIVRWSKATAALKAKDMIHFTDDATKAPAIYEISEPPEPVGFHEFISLKARRSNG